MAKTENRRVEDSFVTTCSSIISGTITFFLFMLVTVFPLFTTEAMPIFWETKYWTYCVIAFGMAVIVGILALIMLLGTIKRKQRNLFRPEALFFCIKAPERKKTFTLADAGVIAFWAFARIFETPV